MPLHCPACNWVHHNSHRHARLSTAACAERALSQQVNATNCMHRKGVSISRDYLYDLVQQCTRQQDITAARHVQLLMLCSNFDTINVLGDHLIRMFSTCGNLLEASLAFQRVLSPSLYTWNALISAQVTHQEFDRAIELYYWMQLDGLLPDKVTTLYALKACIYIPISYYGRSIHHQLVECGFDSSVIVGSAVIDMYAKCGSIEDGRLVFDSMPDRDVVSWGAMLAAYTEQGLGLTALELFRQMQEEDVEPNKSILICLMKACSAAVDLEKGRLIHHYVVSQQPELEAVTANSLIDLYAKAGNMEEAKGIFLGLSKRDTVSWALLINGYEHHGESNNALQFLELMVREAGKPNEVILTSALKACAGVHAIRLGRVIHDRIIKSGFESDTLIGGALVDMYAKCKSLKDAHKVFNLSRNVNEIFWSALIGGYATDGNSSLALELFEKMQDKGMEPNKSVLLSALKASAKERALDLGRLLHHSVLKMGHVDLEIASTLVDMYSKCRSLEEASKVFQLMPEHDLVSWSAMIRGYADCGLDHSVLSYFLQMKGEGIESDSVIYLCVLKACGSLIVLAQGRIIHHEVIKGEFELDKAVGSSLVDMYAKCGSLDEAYCIFSNLQCRDVVSWSALIAGYVQHEKNTFAFELFKHMQQESVMPNQALCLCIVKACESIRASEISMIIHGLIVECGFDTDVSIGSALVCMYAMVGSVVDASSVFQKLNNRDVVSWNAIITGSILHGYSFSVLELYGKMQQEGIKPDKVILLSLLKTCANLGAREHGRLMHKEIIVAGFEANTDCGAALVDMYVKCGCMKDASRVFAAVSDRNIVAWSAMLLNYGNQGTLDIKDNMHQIGMNLDDVAFLQILTACGQAGLLEDGQQLVNFMGEGSSKLPVMKHFNCLVDLLSRAGHLQEARDLLECAPLTPDIIGWLSLLSGCRTHDYVELGIECHDNAVSLNKHDASGYVLLSNIYSNAHTEVY